MYRTSPAHPGRVVEDHKGIFMPRSYVALPVPESKVHVDARWRRCAVTPPRPISATAEAEMRLKVRIGMQS